MSGLFDAFLGGGDDIQQECTPAPQDCRPVLERVIEVPRVKHVQNVVEVPVTQRIERVIDVPQIQIEEKEVYVPKIQYKETIIEVPKIEYVEKIEYDDQIEYREVPVDKVVVVKEYRYIPRLYKVEVPEKYYMEVSQKKQVDVDRFARDQIHRVDQHDGSSAWVNQNHPQVAGGDEHDVHPF